MSWGTGDVLAWGGGTHQPGDIGHSEHPLIRHADPVVDGEEVFLEGEEQTVRTGSETAWAGSPAPTTPYPDDLL